MTTRILLAAAIVSLLGACATTRMSDAESLSLYSAHAGEPVRTIRYFDPISWEKVDDNHLLLTMRPREVYLLTIGGPCLGWGGASPAAAWRGAPSSSSTVAVSSFLDRHLRKSA